MVTLPSPDGVYPARRLVFTSLRICAVALLCAVAVSGCVSRNVERIGSEEAATIPPPPQPRARAESATSPPPRSVNRLSGIVNVAPELAQQVPSEAVLYLIVRVAGRQGGPPLAVQRLPLPSFPYEFVITEDDAMVPGTPLMGEMTVLARVDQDGDALTSTSGDLLGQAGPVEVGAEGIEVTLTSSRRKGGVRDRARR